MDSKCPNCGKQNTHEDFLFEVVCECGSRYNPFMQGPEPSAASPEEPSSGGVTESQAVFQEIQAFGENLGVQSPGTDPIAQAHEPTGSLDADSTPNTGAETPSPSVPASECAVIAHDSLPGYRIERFYLPLSTVVALSGDDPLRQAFQKLTQLASRTGANALISTRWSFSPDGSKVLVSATPVRWSRE